MERLVFPALVHGGKSPCRFVTDPRYRIMKGSLHPGTIYFSSNICYSLEPGTDLCRTALAKSPLPPQKYFSELKMELQRSKVYQLSFVKLNRHITEYGVKV
ncbi:MAG: hypothetical protein WCA08_13290, partial [Desulfoferrobacter sp.]